MWQGVASARTRIVVVQGWQVIMNQRVGVNHFDGAGRCRAAATSGVNTRAVNAKDRRMRLPPHKTL